MKPKFVLPLLLLAPFPWLMSCTTTFSDREKLPVTMSHAVQGDRLTVVAKVENQSDRPVTFIHHPDFYWMEARAVDRAKGKTHNALPPTSFARATEDNLETVQPGEAAEFVRVLRLYRPRSGTVDLASDLSDYPDSPFERIWDSEIEATFKYGWYPASLPKHAGAQNRNYVKAQLESRIAFPRP